MHVMIEDYPEFLEDIKELWCELLTKFKFEINQVSSDEVKLTNDACLISLYLNCGDRIGYHVINRNTGTVYDLMSLLMFSNKKYSDLICVGDSRYPISEDTWFEFIAEDDYRSVCRIDLPLIKDELLLNWGALLKGNFSEEKDFLLWRDWHLKPENKRKSMDELSYNSYLKQKL